jgi:hypothetical protein
MAIMNAIAEATAIIRRIGEIRQIPENRGRRIFDHELTAEHEAIPKHLCGITCRGRNCGAAAQQQRANDLHDASPWLEVWLIRLF